MNIYEKILAIMNEVQYLAKDDHVSFGSTSYKALSEEKVTSVMRQKLVKYKLIVYPIAQTASRDKTITHVDVIYRMQDTEDPSQYIDIASCGDGADTQDKGMIAWFVSTRSKDQALNKARMSQGTLIASGFIAGGALMGVVGAILKFADVDWKLTQWNSSNAASWVGLGMYLALIIYFAVHSLRAKKEE